MNAAARFQFRLSGLLWAICLGAMLCAWFVDHSGLARKVADLEQQRRQIGLETRQRASHWIAEFARQHGGNSVEYAQGWMWVDLQETAVGDDDLVKILPEMKVLDTWRFTSPRCLALYGSRVTEAFAARLRDELTSWTIVTVEKIRREDAEPKSS